MSIFNKTVLGRLFFYIVSLSTFSYIGPNETIGAHTFSIVAFSSIFLTFASCTYDRLVKNKL